MASLCDAGRRLAECAGERRSRPDPLRTQKSKPTSISGGGCESGEHLSEPRCPTRYDDGPSSVPLRASPAATEQVLDEFRAHPLSKIHEALGSSSCFSLTHHAKSTIRSPSAQHRPRVPSHFRPGMTPLRSEWFGDAPYVSGQSLVPRGCRSEGPSSYHRCTPLVASQHSFRRHATLLCRRCMLILGECPGLAATGRPPAHGSPVDWGFALHLGSEGTLPTLPS